MHSEKHDTHIQMKADPANLDPMLEFVHECASQAGLSEQELFDIRLGCEEVIANIINHGYPGTKGMIDIVCAGSTKHIEITIKDKGIAFDPLSLPEPDIHAPFEERKIGGLGVFFVRKVFDQFTYDRHEDTNIVTLIKSGKKV